MTNGCGWQSQPAAPCRSRLHTRLQGKAEPCPMGRFYFDDRRAYHHPDLTVMSNNAKSTPESARAET